MATRIEKRGTCPACMDDFQCATHENGKIVLGKHGWKEVGGRQVGVYGQATHVDKCFGVDWAPFEHSPDGTWAFLREVVYPGCLMLAARIDRLSKRPPLNYTVKVEVDGKLVEKIIKLTPESAEGAKLVRLWRKSERVEVSVYDLELESRAESAQARFNYNCRIGATLYAAAIDWVARELREGSGPAPTIHRALEKPSRRTRVWCGSVSRDLHETTVDAAVTCVRCKKQIEKGKKDALAREAFLRDVSSLREILAQPHTIAEIKKATGWTTKRVNAVLNHSYQVDNPAGYGPGTMTRWVSAFDTVYRPGKPNAYKVAPPLADTRGNNKSPFGPGGGA